MSRRTILGVAVPLALVLAYFGVTSYVRAHVDELVQHAVDKPLPDFSLVDRDGKAWSRADLAGKRAVLHFFRSYCHSCDVEAPAIRALEQAKPDDAVILHVMTDVVLDVEPAVTDATVASKRFSQPVLMADEPFMELFHKSQWSQVTPITYVVDAAGVVRYALRGMQPEGRVEAALAAVGAQGR